MDLIGPSLLHSCTSASLSRAVRLQKRKKRKGKAQHRQSVRQQPSLIFFSTYTLHLATLDHEVIVWLPHPMLPSGPLTVTHITLLTVRYHYSDIVNRG